MSSLLWQLYDPQSRPVTTAGATKHEVAIKGLLHGAVHVWLWAPGTNARRILLQNRATAKLNWPGRLDKSAGGHMLFGEGPLSAAIRKTREELAIQLHPQSLQLVGTFRWYATIDPLGVIENELQWIFAAKISADTVITPAPAEVLSVSWKDLPQFRRETCSDTVSEVYVPYGRQYFQLLCDFMEETGREA